MDIQAEINKKGQRFTKQRQIILEYLKSVHTHPTAEMVYKAVRKQLPNISLGTVYRNLSYLSANGYVLHLDSHGKSGRFDGDISQHQHFICRECGRVYDIFNKKVKIKRKLSIGMVDSIQSYYYGICKYCYKKGI